PAPRSSARPFPRSPQGRGEEIAARRLWLTFWQVPATPLLPAAGRPRHLLLPERRDSFMSARFPSCWLSAAALLAAVGLTSAAAAQSPPPSGAPQTAPAPALLPLPRPLGAP